ncbi:serine hydrolase [Pilimelia terevasa]|uniref:Serine hydrolase n=1 Tax=Pilimelia terevasa TaxID=53372 RepID=A0A8J3BQC4_9ACTN|nr:serine hydrolase [Pilimelia terevasa]GGK40265.1 serine hydrolase [Pilimelia terevasa]
MGLRGAVAAAAALVIGAGTVALADSARPELAAAPAAPQVDATGTGSAAPAPAAAPAEAPARKVPARPAPVRPAKGVGAAAARAQCATISKPVGDGGFYDYAPPIQEPGAALVGWRERPEAGHNMDAAALGRGGDSLTRVPSMRSLVVVRNGKLAYERYYGTGSRRQSNNVHSASKSLIQALVGVAIERGQLSLDTTVAQALSKTMKVPASQGGVTVRQLLTMTSGLEWEEDETEYTVARSRNWVASILSRPRSGTRFNYSTGNTHVLSAMLKAVTGKSTCEFAAETVLGGLEIAPERWARDPQQVSAGGFNVYLTARELTRFGQLYLDNGMYRGKRVLPAATVTQARTITDRRQAYSAGWWVTDVGGVQVQSAWGWGGQYVCVIPAKGLVVTATQDTSHYDGAPAQDIDINQFLRQYVLPAAR